MLLENATFLDKAGNEIKVADVIDKEEDCWELKKEKKWVISHAGVKKLADKAGISKNYAVDESVVQPSYQNELEHIVRVTIRSNAKNPDGTFVHGDEGTLTMTGEANRVNVHPRRGRGYLRQMAEKRAYDRAVLEYLGLASYAFSEVESEDFEKEPVSTPAQELAPFTPEFEELAADISLMTSTTTMQELTDAGETIKAKSEQGSFSDAQLATLRRIFNAQVIRLADGF